MRSVPYEDDEIVVEDGRAVRKTVTRFRDEPVIETLPLYDEAGERVIIPGRAARDTKDPKTGEVVHSPAVPDTEGTYDVPAMETVTRMSKVVRPVLDAKGKPVTRLGVRYEELAMLMIAYERRERERLTARIAALETRVRRTRRASQPAPAASSRLHLFDPQFRSLGGFDHAEGQFLRHIHSEAPVSGGRHRRHRGQYSHVAPDEPLRLSAHGQPRRGRHAIDQRGGLHRLRRVAVPRSTSGWAVSNGVANPVNQSISCGDGGL